MDRIIPLLKQYRYGILILLIGLGLMMLPTEEKKSEVETDRTEMPVRNIQDQLADILSQIDGAGKVRVLITEAVGETTVYQQDTDISGNSDRQDTVIITDQSRSEQGLVCQMIPPKYQGAIIVCQGGDRPAVRLAIVDAVSRVTGLTSDKISVMKMK